ncbi:hypothetical protein M422DRAFT_47221 [Sphaerobolus stellatus SS14]|uniref:Uncharacterized protein n=1 Tax=Sphaerobolus stellatus (strain SS14) TaxID=990650 RepID=A0A0C9VZT6_SPHS4|nr:hypothetical protein M422DRAFT_47221 [Sphaerobolus stellatus SS14]
MDCSCFTQNTLQCHGYGNVFSKMINSICDCCTTVGVTLEDTFDEELNEDDIENEEAPEEDMSCITCPVISVLTSLHNSEASTTADLIMESKAKHRCSKLKDAFQKMLIAVEYAYIQCHATQDFPQPSFKLGDIKIATKGSKNLPSEAIHVKDIISLH